MFTENPDDPFVLDGETIPGFYWSANSPFIPPADFMVTRVPSQWYSLTATIDTPITEALRDEDTEEAIQYTIGPDANPIHIIREALTNATWGGGVPTTLLDDTAWRAAALTLFNENFGISIIWLQQVTIEKFIENILNHIDANVFVNRRTGLFTIKLLRDDYVLADLPVLTGENSDVKSFIRRLPSDLVNEVNLTFTNPANEKQDSVTIQNIAAVDQAGGNVNPDGVDMIGIRNERLAWDIAQREIAARSSGLRAGEVTADRSAWAMTPGMPFLLTSEDHGVEDLVMRVLKIDYGRSGDSTIQVNAIEDIFSRNRPQWAVPARGIPPGLPRAWSGLPTNRGVILQWLPPANIGGSAVTYDYQVDDGDWISNHANVDVDCDRVSRMGRQYGFRLRARNDIGPGSGDSGYSNYAIGNLQQQRRENAIQCHGNSDRE